MSSDFLSWVASGLIAIVLLSTLWMAWVIHPEKKRPSTLARECRDSDCSCRLGAHGYDQSLMTQPKASRAPSANA